MSAALVRSRESRSVRIIDATLDGRIELVMSPLLLKEIADVLSRPRIRKRLSAEDAQLFLADVAAQVLMLADPPDPPSVCRDPDDGYLVALAVVAAADVLVSEGRERITKAERHVGLSGRASAHCGARPRERTKPTEDSGLLKYRYRDSNPGFRRERAAS